MKSLYLIRHAKSSWDTDLEDHDRPLEARGITDAHLIGSYLKSHITLPETIYCSTSERTRITSSIILSYFNPGTPINYISELYDFSGEKLTQVIYQCDKNVKSLLVFGHNYAITNFVNTFGNRNVDNIPTCGCVRIEFNTNSWDLIKNGLTTLMIFPKDLKHNNTND